MRRTGNNRGPAKTRINNVLLYVATELASTKPLTTSDPRLAWRAAGLPYFAASYYLRQRFGRRVQKVSIDAGFTCPNVDGTVALGGFKFCDKRSFSPHPRGPPTP